MPALSKNDVNKAESKGQICSGIDGEMAVRQFCCTGLDRVDNKELCSLSPRLHDEGPKVDVGVQNVRAPGNNQTRVSKLFRLGTQPDALG